MPALFGCEVSSSEHKLFSLPTKFGGLGIIDPITTAARSHNVSVHATATLTKAIKNGAILDLDCHVNAVLSAHLHDALSRDVSYNHLFDSLSGEFDSFRQCAILRAKNQNILAWLTALPLVRNQFYLSAQEFRDGLALQYKKPLIQMPQSCEGCGGDFCIEHALSCRFSRLVVHHHN